MTKSIKLQQLEAERAELADRIKEAQRIHDEAKKRVGTFEGDTASPIYAAIIHKVDTSLTHLRVLQAAWHLTEARILDRLNIEQKDMH